jgi:hypothetical protein
VDETSFAKNLPMASQLDRINRHSELARHDRQDLYDLLDAEHNVGTLPKVHAPEDVTA